MTILVLKNKIYIDKIKTVYNEKLILNLLKTMPGKNIDEKNISNIVEELKNKYRFKLENVEITVEELYKKLKNIREDIFKYLSKRFDTKTSIDILNLFFIKRIFMRSAEVHNPYSFLTFHQLSDLFCKV